MKAKYIFRWNSEDSLPAELDHRNAKGSSSDLGGRGVASDEASIPQQWTKGIWHGGYLSASVQTLARTVELHLRKCRGLFLFFCFSVKTYNICDIHITFDCLE